MDPRQAHEHHRIAHVVIFEVVGVRIFREQGVALGEWQPDVLTHFAVDSETLFQLGSVSKTW